MLNARQIVGLGAILLLSACAKVGDLERPAPLFGDKARADYARQQEQEKEKDPPPRATQNFPAVPAPNP